MEWLKRLEPQVFALTRIVVGFLFLCHGVQKVAAIVSGNVPEAFPLPVFYLAALIETVGGALVALGLFAVPAAFLCSGMMAVAYFMVHQPQGLLPIQNRGEPAALFCWIFLLLAARGPGIWSVDAARGQGK